MLCFVVHRLGDPRKSAREVGASRLFCFNAGFSGSPDGLSFRRAVAAQFLCISRLIGSRYLLTTVIFGVFFRSKTLWVYPMIAATLFVAHEQFLFTGWKLPNASHVETQMFGA